MPESEHPYDSIADELGDWMNGEVDYYVEAMRGGHRAPFSADVSEQDKLDYYRRQMYMTAPDGTVQYDKPNGAGRDKIIDRLGLTQYAQIMDAVRPKRGLRAISEPEEPEAVPEPPTPVEEMPT